MHIHFDPHDLRLVEETTAQTFVEPLLQMLGPSFLTADIVDRIRAQPKDVIAPLLDAFEAEDGLWFCESERIGPLYGHKGIALVRNGRPVIYLRIITY